MTLHLCSMVAHTLSCLRLDEGRSLLHFTGILYTSALLSTSSKDNLPPSPPPSTHTQYNLCYFASFPMVIFKGSTQEKCDVSILGAVRNIYVCFQVEYKVSFTSYKFSFKFHLKSESRWFADARDRCQTYFSACLSL